MVNELHAECLPLLLLKRIRHYKSQRKPKGQGEKLLPLLTQNTLKFLPVPVNIGTCPMTQQNQAREEMPQNSQQSSLYSSTNSLDVLNNYLTTAWGYFRRLAAQYMGNSMCFLPNSKHKTLDNY